MNVSCIHCKAVLLMNTDCDELSLSLSLSLTHTQWQG
uniref:Uncharacterized protein n=1 Tax=Anguilla anguilla TaxID=7936 RepID=A0A0E9W5Y0_ANGAN